MFMPSMHTIRHIKSKVRHNYACPYMQVAPRLVADALDFGERGIGLISPLMDMDFGQQALATALWVWVLIWAFRPRKARRRCWRAASRCKIHA